MIVSVIPRSLTNQTTLRHHFNPRRYPEIFQGSGQKKYFGKLEKKVHRMRKFIDEMFKNTLQNQ